MFLWPVRVYYEDTDSGGVIYYANYLKYMERARTEWLRSLGIEQDNLLAEQGIIFAVHSVALDFLKPGRFNELLYTSVDIRRRRKVSITFAQQVMRPGSATLESGSRQHNETLREQMTVLCDGHVTIACLDAASMRPCHIPEHVLTEITRDS